VLADFFAGDRRPLLLSRDLAPLSDVDRGLARELILGVLRTRTRLDAEIVRFSRFPLERLRRPLREILETAVYQVRFLERVPARAAVHEAVEMARSLAGEGASRLANGVLRSILREPPRALAEIDARSLAMSYSHPEFLVARWLERFGLERTHAILAASARHSPLHLLCDGRRFRRDAVAEALRAEHVETAPLPLVALGLEVIAGSPFRTRVFESGSFYVADAGSQALPSLLPPGRLLLDLAAAPGGKTASALFSARFSRVIAADRSIGRIGVLRENRSRLALESALPVAADVLAAPLPEASFDRVLLDAPCSGTGTLRKNPEIRYRLTAQGINAAAENEFRLLTAAGSLVSPGGYLLYSTCSLEPEENEEVAARFLGASGRFDRAPMDAPEELRRHVTGDRFRIFPDEGSDGFTAHLLRRRS
jgi:16S rRNA (cytosine967-C5)-methyltransferase